MGKLKYIFTSETKALDDQRALIVRITTPAKDRAGDVVVPTGARLDAYRKNPVVLFGHDYKELPIARADELSVDESGITAKVTFPDAGLNERADAVYALWKAGFGNAWSIGFIPDMATAERMDEGGYKINDWEMLEFSAVPVPANAEALTLMRTNGISEGVIKEFTQDEEPAAPEEKEVEDVEDIEVETVADTDNRLCTFSMADGTTVTYRLNGATWQKLVPVPAPAPEPTPAPETPEQPDVLKVLASMREGLRESDKRIGLALRTMNTLLSETNSEGR